jgi:hypothetical protein
LLSCACLDTQEPVFMCEGLIHVPAWQRQRDVNTLAASTRVILYFPSLYYNNTAQRCITDLVT